MEIKERYHVHGQFAEEQRKGFIVWHKIEQNFETTEVMNKMVAEWLSEYNSAYCHSMEFYVKETNKE